MVVIFCIWFSVVCSITSAVEIEIKEESPVLGQDLELMCLVQNCCSADITKRWHGGPDPKLLMFNNGETTDKKKYYTEIKSDGYVLIIRNLSERDLNKVYECSYGFERVEKNLTDDIIVKNLPTKVSQKSKDLALIGGIIGGIVAVLLLLSIAVFIYCRYRKPKQQQQANTNITERAEIETFIPQNYQVIHQDIENVSGSESSGYSTSNAALLDRSVNSASNGDGSILDDEPPAVTASTEIKLGATCAESTSHVITTTVDDQLKPLTSTSSISTTNIKTVDTPENEPVGNNPIERGFQYTIKGEKRPLHNAYEEIGLRISSFTDWPLLPPKEKMAEAGFFCSAYGTCAKCFFCGRQTQFVEGDNPFDEIFHYHHCGHLQVLKREKTIYKRREQQAEQMGTEHGEEIRQDEEEQSLLNERENTERRSPRSC